MMESETPSVLDSAAVVSLRPGDVVLFRCPGWLNKPQRDHVIAMLNDVFPAHESIILDGGQDIALLRPEPGIFGRMWRRMFSWKASEAG